MEGESKTRYGLLPVLYLIFGSLVLPFLYFDNLIDPVIIPRFSFLASLLSLSWLILLPGVASSSVRMPRAIFENPIVLSISGYFAFSLIALSQASNVMDGLFEALKVFLFMGTFTISSWILRSNHKRIGTLISLIAVCTSLSAVIAILQYYGFPFCGILTCLSRHFTVDSTLGNQNLLASFLLLSFPFLVAGYLTFSGFRLILCAVSAGLVLYLIPLLQSRAVWVAFAVSLAIVLVVQAIQFSRADRSRISARRLIGLMLLLLVAIVLVVPTYSRGTPIEPMRERIESIVDPEHPTVSGRFNLWNKTVQMIRENPILGVGTGNWKINYPAFGLTGTRGAAGKFQSQRPHNDFLWIISEIGWIGFSFYLMIFLFAAVYCIKSVGRLPKTEQKTVSLMMLFALSSYLVVSFFSYPRERMVHQQFLAFILAVIATNRASVWPASGYYSRNRALFIGSLFLVVSLFCTVVGVDRYISETHTRKVLVARARGDVDGAIREAGLARSRFYVMDPTVTPLMWYRGVGHYTKGNLDRAEADFEEAFRIHPNHLHVLNNLASCFEQSGEREEAIALYERALKISARFEPALINLAAVYFQEEDYEKAREILSRCSERSKDPRRNKYMKLIQDKLDEAEGN